MDRRLKISVTAAALLAASAALFQASLVPLRDGPGPGAANPPDIFQVAAQPSGLEQCLQSARIISDVYWAAACSALAEQGFPGADGHAECDLPEDRAAVVNAWLDDAESRCMVEVRPAAKR